MNFIFNVSNFKKAFEVMPLIGILRGVKPDEVEAVAGAVLNGGIRIIEIPLNSPDPLISIGRAAKALAGRAIIGAGTVLNAEEVESVAAASGQLIVSPNFNHQVVERTKGLGLVSAPGVMTPSEAFAALAQGADVLKLFPGEILSLPVINALATVLPKHVPLVLVGGVTAEGLSAFKQSPVSGFGVGSSLYKPGMTAFEAGERSRALVDAMQRAGFGKN
jgi:2-dehydro-3-deoxyphosphogalactonate aldolase